MGEVSGQVMSGGGAERDFSCGVIPVRRTAEGWVYLLVQHQAGHWGFPKGHPERGETDEQAALRELREETGLVAVQLRPASVFREQYRFVKSSGRAVEKIVVYFLGWVSDTQVQVQPEEVQAHAWDDYAAARERMTFEEGRHLLDRVEAVVRQEMGVLPKD